MNPTFDYEKLFWDKGLKFIGGADEVGRGAFAGPVVAGVVVFDSLNCKLPKGLVLRDSKKMTEKQRELTARWLRENTYWGLGEVSVRKINKLGIGKASSMAFRKAVKELSYHLPKNLDHLLVDAFFVPYLAHVSKKRQTPVIKGDEKCMSIAGASIIAKVHRDKIMKVLAKKKKYKVYRWNANVGYGTLEHRIAIANFGQTKHHRTQFIETYLRKKSSFLFFKAN